MLEQVQSRVEPGQLVEIDIEQLKGPTWQLRPVKLALVGELERSIKSVGLLQPIVVRKCGHGYEVVFGLHRLEACRRLGLKQVRATVMSFDDENAFLARVSENLLRNSYVDPLEEAKGYQMLLKKGWTIDAIGQRIGKCDSYVCERLAMLERLSDDLRSQVSNGDLTPSHAEILSRIKDKDRQNAVAELVTRKRLSVRSLEDMVNGVPPPTKIRIESISNQLYARIPTEFADAIGMRNGAEVFLYLRGSKLIIESVTRERPSMDKRSSQLSAMFPERFRGETRHKRTTS